MTEIPIRVGLQQRVLPGYRVPFFNMLGEACSQGLSVFCGLPRASEAIETQSSLEKAQFQVGHNIHISSGKSYFCFQQGLLQWLEEWQPKVLIVEANPRYLSTPAAIKWMHKRNRPVIGWGLGAPKSKQAETFLRNRFLDSLDAIIAYSTIGAEQYKAAGINPAKVFVAPNAATPRPIGKPDVRPEFFDGGRANLLFIGRLQERKRVDTLIKACALLPKEVQPSLVIVGDGTDRSRLEKVAFEVYPLTQFVGAKHGLELEPYFTVADLFVLPGTGGLAVQQALAHALPVIVGESDGTQSELVRLENGWVLPATDVNALSQTILIAIQNVKQLREMGLASYKIVSEEINLENMVNGFSKAIKSVL